MEKSFTEPNGWIKRVRVINWSALTFDRPSPPFARKSYWICLPPYCLPRYLFVVTANRFIWMAILYSMILRIDSARWVSRREVRNIKETESVITEKIFQLASNCCFECSEWEEKWGSVVSPRGKPPRVSFWCFVKRYFILPRSHAPPREMMYDRSRRPGNHARRGLDSESSSLEDLETSRRLVANLFRGKRERERWKKT